MKRLFILLYFYLGVVSVNFAQEKEYPVLGEKNRIEALRMEELSKLSAFWTPILNISQRFNDYALFDSNGKVKDIIPIAITTFDLQFFRFHRGFGGVRVYVQTPFSSTIDNVLLNDIFAGIGGFGGGNVFDNRKVTILDNKKTVSGTTIAILGEGYTLWSIEDTNINIGGGGIEFRITHNFHQFFGINFGLNLSGGGIRNKAIEESLAFISFGGSIGLTF